jgi:hypothetical protein
VAGNKLTDPRRTRIWVLVQALHRQGLSAHRVDGNPAALVVYTAQAPVTVRCDRGDDGELWFFFPGSEGICPADDAHLADAVGAVSAKVDERARAR